MCVCVFVCVRVYTRVYNLYDHIKSVTSVMCLEAKLTCAPSLAPLLGYILTCLGNHKYEYMHMQSMNVTDTHVGFVYKYI